MNDEFQAREPLRVLCVEDVAADAELNAELLESAGYDVTMTVVAARDEYERALDADEYDVILADYTLPGFDINEVLETAKRTCAETPFICVSGTIGEDTAVELLKQGATDYVLKDRLARLAFAVRRALDAKRQTSARKSSEALYHLLADNISDVLWILDVDSGLLEYVSPSVERMRGFTVDEVMGEPFESGFTLDSLEMIRSEFPPRMEAFLAGDPDAVTRRALIDQLRKDGSVVHTEVVTTLTVDSGGNVSVVGMSRDITQRVEAERALEAYRAHLEDVVQRRTAELEKANAAKSQFLANMSHELRTPLNSIIGFSRVMLDGMAGETTEEQQRQLSMIHNAGQRLLTLINEILDLSKIEAARTEVHPQRFDLRVVIEQVLESLGPLAQEKDLETKVCLPHESLMMLSDDRMLQQILMNLAGNAVKFTDEGHVELEARREGHDVVIKVVDTGCGVAPEYLDGIFEAFSRGNADRRPDVEGAGLGLAISSRLAMLLGGSISVDSELGTGSTFTLTIPAEMDVVEA